MAECEVQRYTRIILTDQIITILTDDEPKIIAALQKKPAFTPLTPVIINDRIAGEIHRGTIIRGESLAE